VQPREATLTAIVGLMAMFAPAAAQTSAPTSFDALNRELQQLFSDAQSRLVRAQVPIHISTEHPLFKWRLQLDPKLRQQLDAARERGEALRLFVEPNPATTNPSTNAVEGDPNAPRIPLPPPTAVINVEYVGLVLNDRGDVLLPLYIEEESLKVPLAVSLDDRSATTARVIATDDKARLTVVRLARPAGRAVRFAPRRPVMGSLMLMVSPTRRQARLAIWAGGQDDNAILFDRRGDVAGIVRNGHVLHATTLAPLVEQLVTIGQVRRPRLGATIQDVPLDNPQRLQHPALGSKPAARVVRIERGSAAESAGLRPGDLILLLGGEAVEDVQIFAAAIALQRGPTEMRVLREGEEITLTVDLQPR
jgi:S1-C subfamily serine protease